ncbi:MAG TPA: hypothetical protein VNI79_04370 [Sphingomicrobium sp.]|nr:hypothetical protein [Sphingomicrobium sp.]
MQDAPITLGNIGSILLDSSMVISLFATQAFVAMGGVQRLLG